MDPAATPTVSRDTLRILRSTSAAMESAQARLASGLRIAQAKDNAGYWSISTAMRSDRRSISAVESALGLGAAVVDTAYRGLEAALPILDAIKTKLATALQPGVDPQAVQGDIEGLKQQLRAIAASSAFLGENWLSVDSGSPDFRTSKSVLASYGRDRTGAAVLGMIEIDYAAAALLDANVAGGAILDKEAVSNLAASGIANASDTGVAARSATGATVIYSPPAGPISGYDKLYYEMEYTRLNGAAFETYVTPGGSWPGVSLYGMSSVSVGQFATLLGTALSSFATVAVAPDGVSLAITSKLTGSMSSIAIRHVDVYDRNGTSRVHPAGVEVVSRIAGTPGTDAVAFRAAGVAFNFGGPFTLGIDDSLTFRIAVDGQPAKLVNVDRATVDRILPGQDGAVASGAAYRDVLQAALLDAGVAGVNVTFSGGRLTFASAATSGSTALAITDVVAAQAPPVMLIDVSNASRGRIRQAIRTVERAVRAVTAGATRLGAVAARIDAQIAFNRTLGDTIDKGIGGLVDADMAQEAARLEALRAKQQLALRSLSITNSLLRNGLMLFIRPSR